jgi:hypothetical protein
MKNIVGNVAQGENFYPRNIEINKIKRALDAGSHIQIAAPRRVGKTSILLYLKDNPFYGYNFVYVITESVFNENSFYKRIYQEILKSDAISKTKNISEQFKNTGNNFLKKLKSIKFLEIGIDLKEFENEEINYYDELVNFIKGIDLQGNKIIVMIDEFPQTIENIIEENKGSIKEAKDFLRTNRSLRQDVDFSNKVQFIYTGSIGLNSTVAKFEASSTINDIQSIHVDPLDEDDAKKLIRQVFSYYHYKIGDEIIMYLLNKIGWYIPYHLQLAISEIMDCTLPENKIDEIIIDKSFSKIIEFKNYNNFNHYYERLQKVFKGTELKFVRELLHYLSKSESISKNIINDFAVKYKVENTFKNIIEVLIYDGYINNNVNPSEYKFNSPLLKLFWQRYEFN